MVNILVRNIYKLLIVCICFEEMFARMRIPFKYIKFLIVPILVSFIFVKLRGNIKIPIKEKSAWIFMIINVFAVVFSIDTFLSIDSDGFEVVKKYIFFPFLIICFYYSNLCKLDVKKLLVFFSNTMLVYAVLSVFFYFVRIPIWNDFQRFYWGRITVGYPTIDAVNCVMAAAIFLLQHGKENKIAFWHRIVKLYILFLFVILQTSGTGIGLLCTLVAYSVAAPFFKKWIDKESFPDAKKTLLPLFLMMLVSASFIIGILKVYDAKLLDNMTSTIQNRISIMTNKNYDDLDINTMTMRVDKFEKAKKLYLKDYADLFLGKGFGLVSYDPQKHFSGFRVFLESQWHLSLFTVGYVGTFFLFLFLFEMLKNSITAKKLQSHTAFATICILVSFFTSCTLMSFALIGSFSLIYAEDKRKLHGDDQCPSLE